MPNSPEYVAKHRLYLNKRARLIYFNKTAKLSYEFIHKYETEHGLDETIDWVKGRALKAKCEAILDRLKH